VIALLLGWIAYKAFQLYNSLQVSGKPNEWVVVINGNNQKIAGIGLQTMRGWGDSVAIFPSKVNKVQFSTSQVTKEMSGLEVSAMICWSVNREGDGPMKAYKNLGSDLTDPEPLTANRLLTAMASAIVRSRIANSTIDEILQKRAELREAIRSEMATVTTGWGVWLETVEITDVKISSGSLFKDMQCKFREDNKKSATLLKLDVDTSLSLEEARHTLSTNKRDQDIAKTKNIQNNDKAYENKVIGLKKLIKDTEVKKKQLEINQNKAILNEKTVD
jgi:hypothetical protein